MGSKKEEERNEKIIRGLMKLPPNRRCINCNSLGPQYVCTNFWSFVCVTCSGIHREFTHRVKSVSMAKFTSQEVEALQNGGNQRARDIYLKDWDLQRQRLPDSSNVDKIRQFIKDVYVDKKYAGGKTSEKPPRDTQSRAIHEDERRASSYHSYSQSPPYDYQYEDRRYGKQAASLTRKPGSDRGRYEGKMSSFVYSPNRLSDDRFATEGSISRVSDYSASSGGDPFRSGAQSPNFQKDEGFSSPAFHLSRDGSSEDVRHRSIDSFPQRSRSAGSFGSFDGNFVSQNSFNSSSEQGAGTQDRLPFPGAAVPGSSDSLDFFDAQAVQANSSYAAPIDLFQLPEAPPAVPIDLFQSPTASSVMPTNAFQPTQASVTSLDLFAVTDQPVSTVTSNDKLPDFSAPRNEGWATFDIPQFSAPTTSNEKLTPTVIPTDSGEESSGKLDLFSSDTSTQWSSTQDSSFSASNISSIWDDNPQGVTASNATNTQLWNAFEDTLGYQPLGGIKHDSRLLVGTDGITSTANQGIGLTSSESAGVDGFHWAASHGAPPDPVSSSLVSGTEYAQPVLPGMGESEPPSMDRKSSNPFDLPFDSELEENTMFLDMTSLQAALPNSQLSSDFLGDVSQPWFPQNSASPYIPSAGQGGVTYLAPQVPSSQIQNVSTQGPVASVGGNPFA